MSAVTNTMIGAKIAKMIIPFGMGILVCAVFFLSYNGCNSGKQLKIAKSSVNSNDSLLQVNGDSLFNAGVNSGIDIGRDAERSIKARNKYQTIIQTDTSKDGIIAFLQNKSHSCDTVISEQLEYINDLRKTINARDGIIALQNERLIYFSKNESILHKLLDSTSRFSSPIELPKFLKYSLDLKLGSGIGAVLALGIEGALSFGKSGIFLETKFLFQDKIRGYVIGGYKFNLYSN